MISIEMTLLLSNSLLNTTLKTIILLISDQGKIKDSWLMYNAENRPVAK